MAAKPELGKLGQLVVSSLEKIIKNASWRKHQKLVHDCKSLIEWFGKHPKPGVDWSTLAAPGGAAAARADGKVEGAEGEAPPAVGISYPHSLFDEGQMAVSAADTDFILQPLHAACETLAAKVVEPALDCFQKMIAHGHLRGEMDVGGPNENKALTQVMDSVCKCYDVADESVELLVLKFMLSAVTSTSVKVHGECLLKAIRTCYNIFLGSKMPVNQTTAKASLTQMLVIVFRRMEADSSTVPVTPIVVADLMEQPSDRSGGGAAAAADQNVTQFVQSFITRVVQDIEEVVMLTTGPMGQPFSKESHNGAFDTAPVATTGSNVDTVDDKEMLDVRYWDVSMVKQQGAEAASNKAVAAATAAAAAASSAAGPGAGAAPAGDATGGAAEKKEEGAAAAANGDSETPLPEADPEKDLEGSEVQISNKLRRDAFLVFRALCKLSMKNAPLEGTIDPFAVRGKIVSLELLKICLENSGPTFRNSDRFVGAIKQYLCLSLLKNCTSSLTPVFQLSCSIFMTLISRFRGSLKAEIGVFFPMIVLRALENVSHANFTQKMIVLRFLERLCVDPQILVDVFVNYDCDVDSSVNIFERLVGGLLKTAQGVPPGADTTLNPAQDAQLRLAAIRCLVGVLRSMSHWTNRQLRIGEGLAAGTSRGASDLIDLSGDGMAQEEGKEEEAGAAGGGGSGGGAAGGAGAGGAGGGSGSGGAAVEQSEAAMLEQRRAYKMELQEGITLFNKKPKRGLDFLIRSKKLSDKPEDVVAFLKTTPGLEKTMIGDFLGEREDFSLKVMHAYMDSFPLTGLAFDEAIREVLLGFRLPGEAQKIDRIMEKFAERFCRCNPKEFTSADTAYVLAYSVIMLNTDAHNPMVKTKMSKADFIKNNRGIDDGKDLPEEFLSALYERITQNEIKMKADPLSDPNRAAQKAATGAQNYMLGLDSILNLVAGRMRGPSELETSDEVVRQMQEQFKSKAGKPGSVFHAATDVQLMRPMLDIVWAPMLAAFSVPIESSEEEAVIAQCLDGFRFAVHVTSVMQMQMQRDAFMTSLAKFTSLHSPLDLKQRNIEAIKAVLQIAVDDGNFLRDAWEHVLTCVSRLERLRLIAEGAPTDDTFFASAQHQQREQHNSHSQQQQQQAQQHQHQHPHHQQHPHHPHHHHDGNGQHGGASTPRRKLPQMDKVAKRGSYDSTTLQQQHQRTQAAAAAAMNGPLGSSAANALAGAGLVGTGAMGLGAGSQMAEQVMANLALLEQISPNDVARIFTRSERLNSEGIVEFVKALSKVSMDELRSPSDPRVYSMTKIVEISHYNMNRIRLVWSRMWAVLADYFVTIGCMDNLSVAMYAIDSLRQLAMKFLEREELANYNFQNEFLKPFVVVMRRTGSVEIRELIIRCVSQMVFTRVANVKSGWKIMFMVFTTAATDDHKNIVLLAFETIEKVVREYFPYITETETTTFTDCVNCLIAFTNSRFNKDVSLNAIAFLRFCALKLAEGELGAQELDKEGGASGALAEKGGGVAQPGRPEGNEFTDKDDHLYFWFPLLAGLSELTFDPRPDIRKSALEVLFDTLRFHGHMFSPALWERVFDSVLFPIFDYVRRASELEPVAAPLEFADEVPGAAAAIGGALGSMGGMGGALAAAGAPGASAMYSNSSFAVLRHSHHKGAPLSKIASPGAKGGAAEEDERGPSELEMDAWLYETCTLALQLVVDLFVKFYPKVHMLLGKILALLSSFIRRPHQSLAAIGVAAFVRLMNNAGSLFTEDKWDQVLHALKDSAGFTLPDLAGVVRAAEREVAEEERRERRVQQKEAARHRMMNEVERREMPQEMLASPSREAGEGGEGEGADGQKVPVMSLQEAVADVRCKIAVQLLLVQAMTEIYSVHGSQLSNAHALLLLDTLLSVGSHAHSVNSDRILRSRLQDLRMATQMPDPPLLRLESESYHTYLALLQRLPREKPALAKDVDVELRLVKLCEEVLKVYIGTSQGKLSLAAEEAGPGGGGPLGRMAIPIPLGSVRRRELVARAPLVVATLGAVTALKEDAFRKHLPNFFPLLADLVACEHGSSDVQVALSRMFANKISAVLFRTPPPATALAAK